MTDPELAAELRAISAKLALCLKVLSALVGPLRPDGSSFSMPLSLEVLEGGRRGKRRTARRANLTVLQGETAQERTKRLVRDERYR